LKRGSGVRIPPPPLSSDVHAVEAGQCGVHQRTTASRLEGVAVAVRAGLRVMRRRCRERAAETLPRPEQAHSTHAPLHQDRPCVHLALRMSRQGALTSRPSFGIDPRRRPAVRGVRALPQRHVGGGPA
jgi:hypothetical protein